MRLAIQARAFAARRTAIGPACLVAAGEFLENRAARGGLRLAGPRLHGAADGEPLALAYLRSARAVQPLQHVRYISQHVHHLHLLQQFIHRLTLRVEQHGAPARAWPSRASARQPATRDRIFELIRDARLRGAAPAGESARQPIGSQRLAAMLRTFLQAAAPRTSAMPRMFLLDTAPRAPQAWRAAAPVLGEPGIRAGLPMLRTRTFEPAAGPFVTIVALQPNSRPHMQQLHRLLTARHIATFARATRERLTTREFRRLLVGLRPARAASNMTFQTAIVQLAHNAPRRLGRYGEAPPHPAPLAFRQQPQARPADMKREIERIERTVQTKVVREILHQGHQQQQIRTAVSDALLSSKIVQTLARQIHATLEQRANVERYRKGGR
ncbi:MAG TPA: hypothetical protein VKS80_14510 [Trinickia sp.]|nr:hypothetical protein [Trinickia sp.]